MSNSSARGHLDRTAGFMNLLVELQVKYMFLAIFSEK
jgi:hypothetical protein